MSARAPLKGSAIKQTAKRAWRRYRAIPRRWRWPSTFLLALFLVVVLTNLIFGSSLNSRLFEFRLQPGGEDSVTIFVDPGRNSVVFWTLIDSANGEPQIEAALAGPGLRDDDVRHEIDGSIRFKGGFTRSEYAFFMRNTGETASGVWRITWSVR